MGLRIQVGVTSEIDSVSGLATLCSEMMRTGYWFMCLVHRASTVSEQAGS